MLPDLLSRIYHDKQLETTEISAEVMTEHTNDPLYEKLFDKVAKNPTDQCWYIATNRMLR